MEEGGPDVERVFRSEYGRAVSVLVRAFGDIDLDKRKKAEIGRSVKSVLESFGFTVDWNGDPENGGFCRGVEVTLTLDESKYVGTGPLLFASIIERIEKGSSILSD